MDEVEQVKFNRKVPKRNVTKSAKNGDIVSSTAASVKSINQIRKITSEEGSLLKNVFDNIQEGISVLDDNLNIIRVNRWVEDIYADQKPLVGKKCYQAYHKRKSPCPSCPSLTGFNDGCHDSESFQSATAEYYNKWYETCVYPIRDDSGLIIGFIEHIRDITKRQRANKALQESEEKFKNFIEQAPDAVFIHDYDGRLLIVNKLASEYTGYSREELLRMKASDLDLNIIKDDHKKKYWKKIQKGGNAIFESLHRRKDGTTYPVEIREDKILLDKKPVVLAFARDITESKKVEEALKLSEQKLQNILNGSPIPLFVIDRDHRIIHWNKALEKYTLFSGKKMIGTKLHWKAFYEEQRPCLADLLIEQDLEGITKWYSGKYKKLEMVEGSYTCTDFFPYFGQTGKWLRFSSIPIRNEAGNIIAAMEMLEDITEQKAAEQSLRQSEERMELVLKGADLGTWDWNIVTGEVKFNECWAQMLGYNLNEIIPHVSTWSALLHPEDMPSVMQILNNHLEGFTDSYETEHRLRHKSGHWVWVLDKGKVIERDKDGKPLRACGTHLDITKRKKAEERLLAYEQMLRSLMSELALIEEHERRRIASGLHDYVCQTLILMKMQLQEIEGNLSAGEANKFEKIYKNFDGILDSIRNLIFDLSSPTLYKFGLEAAIKEFLEERLLAEHGIHYKFHNDGNSKPLTEDVQVLMYQSVREILINVIKHAHAKKVTLDIKRVNDSISITVIDDGVGFNVNDILAVPSKSRSFGLFNVTERLKYIGGSLAVDSRPGHGSRVTLIAKVKN
jgi:PAS domain S-box-containing protein